MSTIPSIVIDQSFGSLGIELTPAQMRITTPRPEMQITGEPPEITIEQQAPQFKVNWKKEYTAPIVKPPRPPARVVATDNQVQINTPGTVGDSDKLNSARARGIRNSQRARQKLIKMEHVQINLNSVPKSTPEVEWTPGVINVNWTRGSLHVDWIGEYMPQVVVDPPFSIDVYLREKPYIKIMVEDGTMPGIAGSHIDMSL